MIFAQRSLAFVVVAGITMSPIAYSATRLVLEDVAISEEQSNPAINAGDAAFSKQDYADAMRSYVAASSDKDPTIRAGALNRIGILYERDLGVPQDYKRARVLR